MKNSCEEVRGIRDMSILKFPDYGNFLGEIYEGL